MGSQDLCVGGNEMIGANVSRKWLIESLPVLV